MANVGEFEVEASGLQSREQGFLSHPGCLPPIPTLILLRLI